MEMEEENAKENLDKIYSSMLIGVGT